MCLVVINKYSPNTHFKTVAVVIVVQLGPNLSLGLGPKVNTKVTLNNPPTENFLKGSRQSRWPEFSMYASYGSINYDPKF